MPASLIYDRDDHLADHVAAQDEYLGLVKFSSIDKFFKYNRRSMQIGCEKDAGGFVSKQRHDGLQKIR
jgi:hypothetical protein